MEDYLLKVELDAIFQFGKTIFWWIFINHNIKLRRTNYGTTKYKNKRITMVQS